MEVAASISNWFTSVSKEITRMATIPSPEIEEAQKAETAAPPAEKTGTGAPEEAAQKDSEGSAEARGEEAGAKEGETAPEGHATLEVTMDKAVDTAKVLGTALFSFANKATKTVTETASKLKHSIEETSILGEFEAERKKFEEEQETRKAANQTALAAVAPWIGYNEENVMKKQILSLSLDSRNFLRDPPTGTQFQFDFQAMFPVALATLEEDPNLRKMRFELVPKKMTEERFWRNYFYRVSLVKQSASLSSMTKESEPPAGEKLAEKQAEKKEEEAKAEGEPVASPSSPNPPPEFLSDACQGEVSEEELQKVREQLGILNQEGRSGGEAEWEKELVAELNDYEMVADETGKSEKDWEDEISQLLQAEGLESGEKTGAPDGKK